MNERFTKPDYLFIKPHFADVIINCMLPSKGLYKQKTLCGWLGLLLFFALGTLSASAKSDQLVQPKNQGYVDSFVVDGNQFIAQGWAGSSKPNDKVVSLSIWLADTLVYEGGFEQFDRPDVAEATGRNDWLKSGWRVSAALPDNIKAGKYSLKVLARLDSGMEANLSIQSEAVSVNINNYHISHFVKGVVFVLTLLALLYILLIVAKLFPSFELPKKLLDLPTPSKLKGENWINRIFFFAVILAGGKFLLMKFTTFTNINFLAIILATISSFAFARGTYCKNSSFVTHGDKRKSILLIVVIFFYLGWIYSNGFVLPAHDPIAVPTFASILNQGKPLYEYYTLGESGATYPPGLPLLLSYIYIFLDDTWVLLIFKVLCILAVCLLPFSWSWLAKRIFNIPLPLTTIAIAFYIASFGIERTLNYALPFAGKNAQLCLLSMFPIFFVYLASPPRGNWLYLAMLGFLFYCLMLFHYSFLYITFAFLMAVSIIWFFLNPKQSFALAARGLFVGIIGVTCFILFSNEALHDPRRTLGGTYDLTEAFTTFIQIFFGGDTQLLAIFTSHQYVGSPIRGYFLIGCLLFSAIVMSKMKTHCNETSARSIFLSSGGSFLTIVILAALGSGLVPAGINLDFYRWLIFPAQIGVIACGLLSAYMLLKNINRKVAITYAGIFLTLPVLVFVIDTLEIKKIVDSSAITQSELQKMRNIIIPGQSGCVILSPNLVQIENFTYAQKYRMLEYAEMLTNCRMLAGSWVHSPTVGWRNSNGLTPSSDLFKSIPNDMIFYFVGTHTELEQYGKSANWTETGLLPREQIPIWKMRDVKSEN